MPAARASLLLRKARGSSGSVDRARHVIGHVWKGGNRDTQRRAPAPTPPPRKAISFQESFLHQHRTSSAAPHCPRCSPSLSSFPSPSLHIVVHLPQSLPSLSI